MQVKIHESYRKIVAVADTNLLGMRFEEGIRQITVTDFFKGEEKSENETIEILKDMQKEDATFNIIGEKSIDAALKAGVIKKEGIFTIQNVPVALMLM